MHPFEISRIVHILLRAKVLEGTVGLNGSTVGAVVARTRIIDKTPNRHIKSSE